MNILYFIDHLRPDGTQFVLRQLVEGLATRGHEQMVVCLNDSWDASLVHSLHKAGAQVRFVGRRALVTGIGLLRLWHWLRCGRFDVAVTLLFASDTIGRALARAAGVPRIVSSLRARNVHYTSWQRWLVRHTMCWADVVVINSMYVRDFAVAEEGAPPDRIHVIPNGVYVGDYNTPLEQTTLRTEFGLPPDGWLVGSVGRLTHQKGFDVLLVALSLLPHQDVHLLLIGTGELETSLRALAARLSLQKHVHFAGYRRDVPRLLGALDLYVHAARFEGMPNALLEAMAARCPIVASAVDGICDLLEDGVHGWVVPAENANALAAAIQVALSDPREGQRRAAAAQQRVTHFNIESMVVAWERILMGGN